MACTDSAGRVGCEPAIGAPAEIPTSSIANAYERRRILLFQVSRDDRAVRDSPVGTLRWPLGRTSLRALRLVPGGFQRATLCGAWIRTGHGRGGRQAFALRRTGDFVAH